MGALLSVLAAVGGVGVVVHVIIKGVRLIAGKTKNKVDDRIADVLDAAEPVLKEIALDAVKGKPTVGQAVARAKAIDHRIEPAAGQQGAPKAPLK